MRFFLFLSLFSWLNGKKYTKYFRKKYIKKKLLIKFILRIFKLFRIFSKKNNLIFFKNFGGAKAPLSPQVALLLKLCEWKSNYVNEKKKKKAVSYGHNKISQVTTMNKMSYQFIMSTNPSYHFFVYHSIFHKSQLVIYWFYFPHKIIKV